MQFFYCCYDFILQYFISFVRFSLKKKLIFFAAKLAFFVTMHNENGKIALLLYRKSIKT